MVFRHISKDLKDRALWLISHGSPRETKLCKRVCLDPMDLGLASLRVQTHFATSQLWPHWTSEGSPEFAKATDACGTLEEAKKSYNELFRGLCTERGKGKLLVLLRSSEGMLSPARGKARESGPELRKCADSGYEGMGGQRDAPGALWGSVTRPAGAAAYQRPKSLLQVLLLKSHPVEQEYKGVVCTSIFVEASRLVPTPLFFAFALSLHTHSFVHLPPAVVQYWHSDPALLTRYLHSQ
ncbi:hypothetical protein V8E52_009346 [Russula decolorans]